LEDVQQVAHLARYGAFALQAGKQLGLRLVGVCEPAGSGDEMLSREHPRLVELHERDKRVGREVGLCARRDRRQRRGAREEAEKGLFRTGASEVVTATNQYAID
jgi:hypothetical protein